MPDLNNLTTDSIYELLTATGANVITINMTPPHIRQRYLIYDGKRKITSLESAINIANTLGMKLNIQP